MVQTANVLLKTAQEKANLPFPYDFATIGTLKITEFHDLPDEMKKAIRKKCPTKLVISTDGGVSYICLNIWLIIRVI